ncbi:MAG: hypothetical protein BYD32DRAFT_458907 [Podila humilis]|nr:MAG: hypothetical protein BYD32DRAFT_458907 [Podila humilis]
MLNHDNLARHTLHHQELDLKRDFVQEYLESLDPLAAPEQDAPEQGPVLPTTILSLQRTVSAPVSSLMVKGSGGTENSKASQPRQRHHHHHLHHNHNHHNNQDKDKKGRQHDFTVPSSLLDGIDNLSANARALTRIESEVPKHSPRKKVKSRLDNLNTNDNMKRKDASKARKDNAKHEKRRKKQMYAVELDVEKLDINTPHYDVHHILQQETNQPERATRMTTTPEKAKPTASSRKRVNKSKHRHDDLHDKQPSEQPQSDERQGSRYRHRPSLEDPENNQRASDKAIHLNNHNHCNSNSNTKADSIHKHNNIININNPTDKYNHKNHSHNNSSKHKNKSTHHLFMDTAYASNEDEDGKELGKKDSKKPRKILAQDSLVLNQFASANTTKGRITLPKASSRLGLFRKGKASQKIAVRDHAHGFSETDFLGRTAATPMSEGSHDRRREEVVTSSYFAKPKDREPKDTAPSPRSESRSGHFTANENTTNTSVLSKHSIERKAQQYAGNVASRSATRSSGLSAHSNDMPPQPTPKYSNKLTTSTHQALIVSPSLLSPGRNSPEHTVDAILQELIPNDRYDNQPREDEQEYGRQSHISQDACLERQSYTRDGPILLEQPFEASTRGYVDTGQYFDMYGYPLEPQSNTRESSVQHFTAVSMANPGARDMYYEWHLEPVYGWPNSGAGYQGYPYNNQGRAASHPGASAYMQQEDSTPQFGYDWHGQGNQQGNQTSNNQAHFEWRPHQFY